VPLGFLHDFKDLESIVKASNEFLKEITLYDKKIEAIKKKMTQTILYFGMRKRDCVQYMKREPLITGQIHLTFI